VKRRPSFRAVQLAIRNTMDNVVVVVDRVGVCLPLHAEVFEYAAKLVGERR